MHPVIFTSRVYEPGGLWTPKIGGNFNEGDPATTQYFIDGRADIREMAGHLKVFFEDIKLIKRKVVLQDRQREEIKTNYFEKIKQSKQQRMNMGQEVSDSEEEDEEIKLSKKVKRDNDLEALYAAEINKEVPLPRLFVFMCKKRPRARMTDVHKSGSRVHIYSRSDGLFGREGSLDHFEASLKDVPDALEYLGLVVLKLPQDAPKSDEPIIYGFVKLQSARTIKIKTRNAIKFGDLVDELSKVLEAQAAQVAGVKKKKKVSDAIKPLHFYRDLASSAWVAFQKEQDDVVDFALFLQMVDFCNIFLVNVQAQRIFKAVDAGKTAKLGISEFENFLMAYDVLAQASDDILLLDCFDSLKSSRSEAFGEFGKLEGLDYSGFIEATQVLGIVQKEEADLVEAFCKAAGIKEENLNDKALNLAQFKKAWLALADVEAEMGKRNIKFETGLLAASRNRERLLRIINDQEESYLNNLSRINEMVENVKRDRRIQHDQRKRDAEAVREKFIHDAEKFIAVRGKEKRVQVKQEQEEKSKKRVEAKVLRNQLAVREAEAKRAKQLEVAENAKAAEKLRSDQIILLGLDRLDLSVQSLREIPPKLYSSEEATSRLSYAVNVDFSRNILERLPRESFFYWMTEARKLKLSQNKIVVVPDEVSNMVKLEILELDTNKITQIPNGFSQLTALQRLDISNNKIQRLPENIGNCAQLRYFYAHSNEIVALPRSLGECFRLEFIDISHNLLREVPEDLEHLIFLAHLDISANMLIQLPHKLGCCTKLRYLDASANRLVFLPDNFSALESLEICDLHNNELIITSHKFDNMLALKHLDLRQNHIVHLYNDLGQCPSLTLLDMRNNKIDRLPPDMGLLTSLQELRLQYNNILSVPQEIGSCSRLQKLEMSRNNISGPLSETFGLATSLISVDFSFNQITQLPQSLVALVKLRELNLTSNLLMTLPENITFMNTLTDLNMSNNKISTIPLQLLKMDFLNKLDLSNNVLTYLPRSISALTFLDTLDLRGNLLRALPVEFTDVFESVPEVHLERNPWSDLPDRWGKMWAGKQSSDGPGGYSVMEAVEYLYGMRSIYFAAEQVWHEQGVFHFTHRMTLKDFLEQIRLKIPHSWHEGLIPHVEYLYMKGREKGSCPVFHELPIDIKRDRNRLAALAENIRDRNVSKVAEEIEAREHRRHDAYDNITEIIHRSHQVEALIAEQRVNDKVIRKSALESLYHNVKLTEQKLDEKRQRRLNHEQLVAKSERKRLMAVVNADRIAREEKAQAGATAAEHAPVKMFMGKY